MIKIRANKTTRNADDYKVLLVGIVCAIVIMMASIILPRLTEYRWYRDFARLTPFYEVQLLYSNVSPQAIEVTIGGTMVKRRCEFNKLYGYIYADDGIRYRVPVHTEAEPVKGNRPSSDQAESWGPWRITTNDNLNFPNTAVPIKWEVIAEHVKCPTKPFKQGNLFISGEWINFNLTEKSTKEEKP